MRNLFYKDDTISSFSLNQWLAISCSFSYMLTAGRVAVTGSLTYAFLLWNLFLAFLPYAITEWMATKHFLIKKKWMLAGCLLVWLLFIPNSFYILTDLFHLRHIRTAPKWFDLLLILSFAWNGLVFGILSVRRAEIILQQASGQKYSLFVLFIVMWLNAWGLYIGRFLRYNSWDVVTKPFPLLADMYEMIRYPFSNIWEWGMISCYAVFMTLLYVTVRKVSENFYLENKTNN